MQPTVGSMDGGGGLAPSCMFAGRSLFMGCEAGRMRALADLNTGSLLAIFRQIDFFDPFDDRERLVLAGRHTHLVAYAVGDCLIQEGSSEERSLFLLLAGGASVVKEGASIPVASLMPGDFFGEVAFLTDRPRTSNVIVHPPEHDAPEIPAIPHLFDVGFPDAIHEATALVLRFDPALMNTDDPLLRIKIKDQIIGHLTRRVDLMHAKVVEITGRDPQLWVDNELEEALRERQHAPLAERERTKDRLIEQLAAFLDELNNALVAC
ncbi:MAG: cyclic nucleotide-binding domain-containing protein [Magnetococcales bacterium]|nr:cyclic nucleotide-binding domain-containing protein [Magnetococcales bacterium]